MTVLRGNLHPLPELLPAPRATAPGAFCPRRVLARFHRLEPALKLVVRDPQRRLGLDAELSRQVDDREQQVAHLLFGARRIARFVLNGLAQLGDLLLDLPNDVARLRPVEARRRRRAS